MLAPLDLDPLGLQPPGTTAVTRLGLRIPCPSTSVPFPAMRALGVLSDRYSGYLTKGYLVISGLGLTW